MSDKLGEIFGLTLWIHVRDDTLVCSVVRRTTLQSLTRCQQLSPAVTVTVSSTTLVVLTPCVCCIRCMGVRQNLSQSASCIVYTHCVKTA